MKFIEFRLIDIQALLATLGGIGFLPKAPGSWASLLGVILGWFITDLGGLPVLLCFIIVTFIIGMWASSGYSCKIDNPDPGSCVIDELVGQWVVLLVIPLDFFYYVVAFITFRVFDIVKIWPASWADRNIKGGFGIMLDDIISGIQSAILILVTSWFLQLNY